MPWYRVDRARCCLRIRVRFGSSFISRFSFIASFSAFSGSGIPVSMIALPFLRGRRRFILRTSQSNLGSRQEADRRGKVFRLHEFRELTDFKGPAGVQHVAETSRGDHTLI